MIWRRFAQTASSKRWLERRRKDPYSPNKLGSPINLPESQTGEKWLSRAAPKLIELDQKFRIFNSLGNSAVIDLGAAPGSWTQVVHQFTKCQIFSIDLLSLQSLSSYDRVHKIQGDFLSDEVKTELIQRLEHYQLVPGLILSDMLANVSGVSIKDVEGSLEVCEAAFTFAQGHLKENGTLVMKFLQAQEFVDFQERRLRPAFAKVSRYKPKSSRSESMEAYFVCQGHLPKSRWDRKDSTTV